MYHTLKLCMEVSPLLLRELLTLLTLFSCHAFSIMSVDEDARWLDWVTKQFESIAGDDKEIDLEEFKTALKVKEAKRFFALFDSDGSGSISLDELLKALNLLIHGSETDKLHFLFQVYDVDGSGSIDPDELRTVLKSCLRESAISLPEEKLDDLTLALFESADRDNSGSITFEELKAELEKFPEVMENLTIRVPFTDTLWLHIRSLGQWTNRLYEHFRRPQVMISETKRLTKSLRNKPKQSQQRPFNFTDHNGTVASNRDEHIELTSYKINWLPQGGSPQAMVQAENGECPQLQECYVDGPYGTPTRRIFTSEHAVLIGAGRFLEMHMYMTSALSKNDMKAIGLQMALDLLAKKEKRDSITGLRTRTQPGRPDWSKVFHKVAEEKKGKVHVFFCGSPALAKVIKAQCEQFGFKFYKENF
ncbi:NOX5 oxidase, partial [Polypterus senegalus]